MSIFWDGQRNLNSKKDPTRKRICFGIGSSPQILSDLLGPRKIVHIPKKVNLDTQTTSNVSQTESVRGDDQNHMLRKPISELPSRFRCIFDPYICFNHVQTMVYDSIFESDDPIIVSAPTGSGKTGVFELAIIKMIQDSEDPKDCHSSKVVYLAPTKALCTERRIDWERKFAPFNIKCIELTSDVSLPINFKDTHRPCILLATPEKWDSVTRTWNLHKAFMQSIRLLLVDEVHLINDGHRGATLEAVITRMKIVRSIIWPSHEKSLRFIAISATVSNVDDLAIWFSTDKYRAKVFKVDPKERPVKLRTIVLGYSCNTNTNDFKFDAMLNHKLPELIKKYSNEKPSLIFCTTRKSAVSAAETICREGKLDQCFSSERRKHYLDISQKMKDKVLQETTRFGVAFHHAGLVISDRRLVEESFLGGQLFILCCTSTLAVGVNLPAHLVIIKNTFYYDQGEFRPYPESSIIQMMGRAGRPQFDTFATALIMTKLSCRDEIEKMLTGRLIIDSHLHKHLTQHINSEIVLGTVSNETIARKWIDSTFLHVRIMKNPENYGLPPKCSRSEIETSIMTWCDKAIDSLTKYEMIERDHHNQLVATDAGKTMAKHYVSLETMARLVSTTGQESQFALLQLIASSVEVIGDIQIRAEQKASLNKLNDPTEKDRCLKYNIEKIDTKEKKALALIQAVFGNITISENSLIHESLRVVKNASRIVSCLREICFFKTQVGYQLLKNGLILSQCFIARLWDDSIYVSRQIEKIGPILSNNLAHNGLTTFESLRRANPRNIEVFCNRLPPFGSRVQQTCHGLPMYRLKVIFTHMVEQPNRTQVCVELSIINGQDLRQNLTLPNHCATLIAGTLTSNSVILKERINDNLILTKPDLTVCFGHEIEDIVLNEEIEARIISDSYVGLDIYERVIYTG